MVGGVVDPLVGGSVDAQALQFVARMNIDRCFLGACAVSPAFGVSAFHPADADFKRALSAASQERAVLAMTDKLDERAPYRVARADEIGCWIVEHDAPAHDVAAFAKAGAHVLRARQPDRLPTLPRP
jgi:DeoR/GlpR family transcriptional regulator of sugar metabolism